jgi:phenylalanine-4-hydroxylase
VGLCLEDDGKTRKILGGALLSSIEESSIALGAKAKIVEFDVEIITNNKYRS